MEDLPLGRSGRLDLYFHPFLCPWDIAAAQLLIAEAGGIMTDWAGAPCTLYSRRILAANPGLHTSFAPLLVVYFARRC